MSKLKMTLVNVSLNEHPNFHFGLQQLNKRYGDSGGNTVQENSIRVQLMLPSPNKLAAISKGMRAVKLCSNKILQFLTVDAG